MDEQKVAKVTREQFEDWAYECCPNLTEEQMDTLWRGYDAMPCWQVVQ